MRLARFVTTLVLLAGTFAETAGAQTEIDRIRTAAMHPSCRARDTRVPVMFVATYHMANPGLDQNNLQADDILAPRRQTEVKAAARALARFRPTRLAVEWTRGDAELNARYRRFRDANGALSRNEVEQLGFRVAQLAGVDSLDALDYQLGLEMGALGGLARTDPRHADRMRRLDEYGRGAMTMLGGWLASGTVTQMLAKMNAPDILFLANAPYLHYMLPIGEPGNEAGAELLTQWYRRNLYIFANLSRVATQGSRVLVLYGQGHVPLLRDFASQSGDMCLVDPLTFLR